VLSGPLDPMTVSGTCMCGERRRRLPLGFMLSDSCLVGNRDSESMEAIQRGAASSHSGHTAAGSGY
jgi:hypothetical protein